MSDFARRQGFPGGWADGSVDVRSSTRGTSETAAGGEQSTNRQERNAMRQPQPLTTVAIVGANTVVENALARLLERFAYEVDIIEEHTAIGAKEALEGADVVLLSNDLSAGFRDGFVGFMRSRPETGRIPVLSLSATLKEEMLGEGRASVAWPIRIRDLARQIEFARRKAEREQG